eukprot:3106724-Amphidinium_carterae.1
MLHCSYAKIIPSIQQLETQQSAMKGKKPLAATHTHTNIGKPHVSASFTSLTRTCTHSKPTERSIRCGVRPASHQQWGQPCVSLIADSGPAIPAVLPSSLLGTRSWKLLEWCCSRSPSRDV